MAGLALQRYLQRLSEDGLPPAPGGRARWRHSLVIPAYRESAAALQGLEQLSRGGVPLLLILVLNRPDSDPDPGANADLRRALGQLRPREQASLYRLDEHTDLYALDTELLCGPLPAARGVGLARKLGCDLALQWMHAGAIASDWLCSTDADATLPADYFLQLDGAPTGAVAATFPFAHTASGEAPCDTATALYELSLHYYVLGLEYAGSPYAFHTLGSCLAFRAGAYAQVRGFPRRAAAEDFYLLNKLAKLGPVARLRGQAVQLRSRYSDRVPFGTGPAVAQISRARVPLDAPLFYHPQCFECLRALLEALPDLREAGADLPALLHRSGLDTDTADACSDILQTMGLEAALRHCRQHGRGAQQFLRQFHQWFDAFRSLKFIRALRQRRWPSQALHALAAQSPPLLPAMRGPGQDIDRLLRATRRRWWQTT